MRLLPFVCILAGAAVGLTLLAGCGKKPTLPTLHPVHGKVVTKDGKPANGGVVQFQSLTDSTVSASGVIGPDGTFSIASFKGGIRSQGAVEGDCRVMIILADQSFCTLKKPCTVKPGDNEVKLVVE